MVKINGKEVSANGKCLADYLKEQGYNQARIAVERNGEIVPKRCYHDTILKENDSVEIVSFVGGG